MVEGENPLVLDDLERISSSNYEEFFRDFLKPNQWCIFSSELTEQWRSRKEWVKNGKPNCEFLSHAFGKAIAPVADCCHTKFGSQVKEDMSVKDFIQYWRRDPESKDSQTLYLKDWHFCKAFPSYEAYETPMYFKSDWLNEFWDQRSDSTDDYRFVYMGPKGSWTPFHVDVLRSFSWSANICGCKKWLIYPPGQEEYLTDRLGNLAYDVTSVDMNDRRQFPNFDKAQRPITVVQREGEVIFVPSGWHHQVMNMEDTISINHNWTNACGVMKMWEHLKSEFLKVQRSIEDCKDMENWDRQCQVILKASCGMNFEEFLNFLGAIAKQRISTITEPSDKDTTRQNESKSNSSLPKRERHNTVFHDWSRTIKFLEGQEKATLQDYCRFDLQKIHECLVCIKDEQSFYDVEDKGFQIRLEELLKEVNTAVGNEEMM